MISFKRARLPWEDPFPELLENLSEDGLNSICETQRINTTGQGTNLFNQNMLLSIVLGAESFFKKGTLTLKKLGFRR
jgi:hypothetical protein